MRKKFLNYLSKSGVSTSSLRFYSSDFNHFKVWMERSNTQVNDLSPAHADAYKEFLKQQSFSKQTINRRLSTMRRISEFLYTQGYLKHDFAQNVINIPNRSRSKQIKFEKVLNEFKNHLENEKSSQSTVKNYVSDVKHFITWLDSNQKSAI